LWVVLNICRCSNHDSHFCYGVMCCRNFFICNLWSILYKSRNLLLAYLSSLYMNYHCFMITSIYTVQLSPRNSGNVPTLLLALHCQLANLHIQIFCVYKCARPCTIRNAAQHRSGSLTPYPIHLPLLASGLLLLVCTQIKQLHFYIVLVWDFQIWFWQGKT